MRTRQALGISMISSLLTVVAVIALLMTNQAAAAQRPVPTSAPVSDPQLPDSPVSKSVGTRAPNVPEAPQAGTAYLHIAGSAFVPMYWDTKPVYDYGGCTYGDATASPSRIIYNLPIILPYGSTITQIRFYYKDSSDSNSTLRLREMDDGQSLVDIASVNSTGSSDYGNATVELTHTVDYVNYSYVLQWYANVAGSTMELCGVRIRYTPPSIFGVALPAILRD